MLSVIAPTVPAPRRSRDVIHTIVTEHGDVSDPGLGSLAMELAGANVVVTGAARGIGEALARRFHDGGANVVVADVLDPSDVADSLERAIGIVADVATEAGNAALVAAAEDAFGPVDLFFANAGVAVGTDLETPEADWELAFNVNVHAHRWAAKYLLDGWLSRGHGYFCSTASAAGLLSQIGSAPYSLTKRAAVAFAEWLSITYGERGIRVSCLCPQGVNTAMLNASLGPGPDVVKAAGAVLEPDAVADLTARAIDEERFLILPHPEVHEYALRKATDIDRWLAGMRRLQAHFASSSG
jgi:NAD(P)-dependent dehydrogenase (short-subunit alcohol dehydrogenase family)